MQITGSRRTAETGHRVPFPWLCRQSFCSHRSAGREQWCVLMGQCFSRSQSISNLNVRNFGRSLLAGYCPTYMPDLVLHGTSNDEKLKQCLVADLVHTVHVSDSALEPSAADSVSARVMAHNRCLD